MPSKTTTKPKSPPIQIPQKSSSSPAKTIEPFQHPAPKLVMAPPSMQPWTMTPPSLSPLHMTPPNMELPNFSPIQDHMPLPTLSASTFIPPQSFLTYESGAPISVTRFSHRDPSVLVAGACERVERLRNPGGGGGVVIFRVEDVEREVRGDREMIARGVYDVRVKIRPRLHELSRHTTSSGVLDVVFHPNDPNTFFACLLDGNVVRYRLENGDVDGEGEVLDIGEGDAVYNLSFSPDGSTAAAAVGDGTVLLLDGEMNVMNTLSAHASPTTRVSWSGDGRRLYSGSADGEIVAFTAQGKEKWRDSSTHDGGITALQAWPAAGSAGVGQMRKLLLTGCTDGKMRVMDMSSRHRGVVQELDTDGIPWRLSVLPSLPVFERIERLGAGAVAGQGKEAEIGGVIAAAGEGGGRVLIHKQKFEEVFLPKRDGSDIVNWTTSDGVVMDHEGREKKFWWYDLADIEEHEDSEVFATDAVAVIDYDPLFKDAGEQRLRRGWRLVSASRDGRMCFWQVYIE